MSALKARNGAIPSTLRDALDLSKSGVLVCNGTTDATSAIARHLDGIERTPATGINALECVTEKESSTNDLLATF